jgi:hypothetical protein
MKLQVIFDNYPKRLHTEFNREERLGDRGIDQARRSGRGGRPRLGSGKAASLHADSGFDVARDKHAIGFA